MLFLQPAAAFPLPSPSLGWCGRLAPRPQHPAAIQHVPSKNEWPRTKSEISSSLRASNRRVAPCGRAGARRPCSLSWRSVPLQGPRSSGLNPLRKTACPRGAHIKRNLGAAREVGLGWGWAIRLGMGRSEVPIVTHITKCFPRAEPQPPAPWPWRPPEDSTSLILAGLGVNLTLSPSNATHPAVQGCLLERWCFRL